VALNELLAMHEHAGRAATGVIDAVWPYADIGK
jgi:hypothetical protein